MLRLVSVTSLVLLSSTLLAQPGASKSTLLSDSLDHWMTGAGEAVTRGWKVEEIRYFAKAAQDCYSPNASTAISLTWE